MSSNLSGIPQYEKEIIVKELVLATTQLSDRGLIQSAKWVAELMLNIKKEIQNQKSTKKFNLIDSLVDDSVDLEEYLVAKSYFDCKEYQRASHTLKGCEGQKSIFLRNYSLFLSGEKRKSEEMVERPNTRVFNSHLKSIKEELSSLYNDGKLDGFGMYLYGIVLSHSFDQTLAHNAQNRKNNEILVSQNKQKLQNDFLSTRPFQSTQTPIKQQNPSSFSTGSPYLSNTTNPSFVGGDQNQLSNAPQNILHSSLDSSHPLEFEVNALQRSLFIESIHAYPWNWGAWTELSKTIKDASMLSRLEPLLPEHFLKPFWIAHTLLELLENVQALEKYKILDQMYPNNTYIKTQLATVYHNLPNYDPSQELFEYIRKQDPYKLEGMDIFSHVLYTKEEASKLSSLAHFATTVDKFTPQTCVITGNYYALLRMHEKAIFYFTRALKLNPKCVDCWTLIGHEFIELKDTHSAIDAYRRAVDQNRKDYRAWYSLGQAYELLQKYVYALYYYERACELRPYDPRLWLYLGNCYASLDNMASALLCYKRAESTNDRDKLILYKLADLYEKLGQKNEAFAYYKALLDSELESDPSQVVQALYFLATYHKENKNYIEAYQYCSRLLDYNVPKKDEVKAMMKEINSIQLHSQSVQQQQQQQQYQQRYQHHQPQQQEEDDDGDMEIVHSEDSEDEV